MAVIEVTETVAEVTEDEAGVAGKAEAAAGEAEVRCQLLLQIAAEPTAVVVEATAMDRVCTEAISTSSISQHASPELMLRRILWWHTTSRHRPFIQLLDIGRARKYRIGTCYLSSTPIHVLLCITVLPSQRNYIKRLLS